MSEKFLYGPLTDQEAEKLGGGIDLGASILTEVLTVVDTISPVEPPSVVTGIVTDVVSVVDTILPGTPATENTRKNGNGTQLFFL